jgi:hypothetical protein
VLEPLDMKVEVVEQDWRVSTPARQIKALKEFTTKGQQPAMTGEACAGRNGSGPGQRLRVPSPMPWEACAGRNGSRDLARRGRL